jgi:hypothetical protein
MTEATIGQVAGGPVLSVAEEMQWGQQYAERQAAAEGTLTQRLVASEILPIPAKAMGVVLLRAASFAVDVVNSVQESA